jgi:uncharacterized membrane protein
MKACLVLATICLLCASALAAPANAPASQALPDAASTTTQDNEEVEEVPDVQPAHATWGGLQIAGRMHPALVHLPIGWLTLTFLLDLLLFAFQREFLRKGTLLALGASALSFVPAGVSGMLRANELTAGKALPLLMAWHRNLTLLAAALCWAAFALRLGKKNEPTRWARWTYLALEAASVLGLAFAGHLGGRMVFGPDYLPF